MIIFNDDLSVSDIYDILKMKYLILNSINLIFIPQNNKLKYMGRCHYDTLKNWCVDGKYRFSDIQVNHIEIVINSSSKYTLIHENAHTLTYHYERKVKDEYIYCTFISFL